MIYKLIFFMLSLLSLGEIFCLKKLKVFRKYVMIFLWFFGSFSMLGIDIEGYKTYYFEQPEFVEFAYKNLNKLFYYIFNGELTGFYFLIAFWNSIILYLIYKCFSEYTPYFYTALFINYKWFFLGNILGGSRQALVIAFFYWTFRFVNTPQKKKYLYNIFMYLVHRSSIMLIPVYLFLKKSIKRSNIYIFLILTMILSRIDIKKYILLVINFIYIPNRVLETLMNYLKDDLYSSRKEITIITIFVTTVILGVSIFFKKRLEKNKYFNISLNTYLLYCFFQYGFTSFYVLSYRLCEFFRNIDAILISLFLTIFKDKRLKLFIWLIIFFYNLISFNRYIQHPTYSKEVYRNYLIEVMKK